LDWGFWALVVALIAIVHQINKGRGSALWCHVFLNQPLVSVSEGMLGGVDVSVAGRPVRSVQVIGLALINAGGKAIMPSDFAEPIVLQMPKGARLLDAFSVLTYEKSVRFNFRFSADGVVIDPVLLNSGECIALRLLIEQFSGRMALSARVQGVESVPETVAHPVYWWRGARRTIGWAIPCIALMGFWVLGRRAPEPIAGFAQIAGWIGFVGFFFVPMNWMMELLPRHPRFHRWGRGHRQIKFHDVFDERRGLPLPVAAETVEAGLVIRGAQYGAEGSFVDVTEQIRARVKDDAVTVTAGNEVAGDPKPGVVKELRILYSLGGKEATTVAREGETITIGRSGA
jgi:hypothetical protein